MFGAAAGQSVWDLHHLSNFLPEQVFALEHSATPKIDKSIYRTLPVAKLDESSTIIKPYSQWLYGGQQHTSHRHFTFMPCPDNDEECLKYL